MPSAGLVSIVVSSFNQSAFIAETIDSLLAQTYPHIEIIAVDDSSTDDTFQILQSYGSKIRCERIENSGSNASRNRGAFLASGDWIAFCDGDDIFLPTKIEKQLRLALASGVDYVICDYVHFSTAGVERRSHFDFAPPGFWGRTESFGALGFCTQHTSIGMLVDFQPTAVCSPLMRRSFFESVGRWDESLSRLFAEDTDFHFRCHLRQPVAVVPEVLWHYRRHPRQKTADGLKRLIGYANMWERILNNYPEAQQHAAEINAGVQALRREIVLDAIHRRRFETAREQARYLQSIGLVLRCKLAVSRFPAALTGLATLRRRVLGVDVQ